MIKEPLARNKKLVLACVALFTLSIPLGYLAYDLIADQVMPLIKDFLGQLEDRSQLDMVKSIFINNYRVCALLMLTGMLIFPTILILFVNGFAIGFVIKMLEVKDHDVFFLIKGIAPHGLFEFPAIFISAAIGLRIGLSYLTFDDKKITNFIQVIKETKLDDLLVVLPPLIIATLDSKKRVKNVNRAIKEAVLINLLVVTPLLVIAAFVEVFITSELLK